MSIKFARCGACGASIMFRTNESGTVMILDREPTRDGNIVPRSDGTVHVLTTDERARVPKRVTRYTDHDVTCHGVKNWRGWGRW